LVDSEEYDIKETINPSQERIDKLKDRQGIEIAYSFNGKEIKEALKIFQRATIYKRNMIYTAVLSLIFLIYTANIIKDPSQGLPIFLCAMCLAVICMIWYMPYSHIKKTAKAADENDLHFNMVVYEDCVKIGEENGAFVLDFNEDKMKAYTTQNLFLLSVGKERVFIIPKRFIDTQKQEQIDTILKEAFKENYFQK
ncbi:MAG: hypothetical protein RR036_03130, partial [Oscillospiraceae bacterium]